MRIISGKYKGRKIGFPEHIRPTQDKVRHAIFNILADVADGARVLDLFAGSGAFGIEALSRGAKKVVFIEIERKCNFLLSNNLEYLGVDLKSCDYVELYRQDAFKAVSILIKRKKQFDIIFADPPYYKGLVKKLLKTQGLDDILTPRGFLVLEHAVRDELDFDSETSLFRLYKQVDYGKIRVSFFVKK